MESIILTAQKLLHSNPEWISRYAAYADLMLANAAFIKSCKKRFRVFPPLYSYISTTYAKGAKSTLKLDLRYRGQTVAVLNVDEKAMTLSTKGYEVNNRDHFGCPIILDNESWSSSQATAFRKHFRDWKNTRLQTNNAKRNEEHNVQDLLLSEFIKRSSVNKQLLGIQPVTICGGRYGIPTPLKASKHGDLEYAAQYGGGIDVFARTGRGAATYLTVIEVKDENKSSEPPKAALEQAIKYAVFIRELLRSPSGDNWYSIFGFSGPVPKQLTLRVVCAMPDTNPDTSFAKQTYPIGNDLIECHYLYFKYNGKRLTNFQSSLNP